MPCQNGACSLDDLEALETEQPKEGEQPKETSVLADIPFNEGFVNLAEQK